MGTKSLRDNFESLLKRSPEAAEYLVWLIRRATTAMPMLKHRKAICAKRYREGHGEVLNAKKRERVECSACGECMTRGSFYNHRRNKHRFDDPKTQPLETKTTGCGFNQGEIRGL